MLPPEALADAVMRDKDRPCLFGVAGPCFHSKCLDAHFETLRQRYNCKPATGEKRDE